MNKKSGLDIVDPILALPRSVKRLVVVAVDAALCIATVWLAYFLRLDEWIRLVGDPFWRADWAAGLSMVIAIPLFVSHGFYRVISIRQFGGDQYGHPGVCDLLVFLCPDYHGDWF